MEIIRTKRATSAAGANSSSGQPKSKYRKRSVSFLAKNFSFSQLILVCLPRFGLVSGLLLLENVIPAILEKHPNGGEAQMGRGRYVTHVACVCSFIPSLITTLSSPSTDYAKLMRKRDKANGNGDLPRIDLETLRASARAADVSDKTQPRKGVSRSNQSIEPASPMETGQPPQHHQGSFQLVSMLPQESAVSSESSHAPTQPTHQNTAPPPGSLTAPPPPWATSVAPTSGRGYPPEHLQHQSFMRSSQHPSSTAHTSPR